jgi:hypothetical protein
VLAVALAFLAAPGAASAATYYVDPAGSDGAAGTSPAAAWRTVARVNVASLAPGDVVRFRGGGVWREMLSPRRSGTAAAPIAFASYGSGRPRLEGAGASGYAGFEVNGISHVVFAGFEVADRTAAGQELVYLRDAHDVLLSDLDLHDAREGVHSSPAPPSSDVVLDGVHVHGIEGGAGSSALELAVGDSGFVVRRSTIEHVADSCVVDQSTGSLYDGDVVRDCGFGVTAFGTHALYLAGPGQEVRDSELADARTNCISTRREDVLLERVRVHGCPIGIAWFDSGAAPGTVTVVGAEVWDATTGIYVDAAPQELVRISATTILAATATEPAPASGISLASVRGARIENTVVTGAASVPLRIDQVGADGLVERGNDVWSSLPGATYGYAGSYYHQLAEFRAASGQDGADVAVDPLLVSTDPALPALAPTAASPLRDRGVVDPATGPLVAACDGAPGHYCGAAPEPGAHELLPHDVSPPTTPGALVASAAPTLVDLAWRPSRDDRAVTGYRIYRDGALVATVTAARATVAPLAAGRSYAFAVTALDGAGHQSTAARLVVRTPPLPPLAAPRVLRRTATTLLVAIPRASGTLTVIVGSRRLRARSGGRLRVVRLRAHATVVLRLERRLATGAVQRSRSVRVRLR